MIPRVNAPDLLIQLIRFNTVNPPGNEGPALDFLAGLLERAGWQTEILAKVPERPNLVARLKGAAPGPTLALISHVDTVPADPSEWTVDPWGGELKDGYIWGRGALDMKDQVASETAACLALAESGWRPAEGDLLLIVAADEETGAHFGAQWLCEEVPERVRCDWVVNEGAGEMVEFGGRRYFTLSVGEEARSASPSGPEAWPATVRSPGSVTTPCSSSRPPWPDSTGSRRTNYPRYRPLPGDPARTRPPGPRAALAEVRASDPPLADLLADPTLGVTLAPTMAKASTRRTSSPAIGCLVQALVCSYR